MNHHTLIDVMATFPDRLSASASALPDDLLRWRPVSGQWSIIEIICHVLDEERDDFRPRFMLCLDDPSKPWPPIDPEGAAVERGYQERDVQNVLNEFADERRHSVEMLRSLSDPAWNNTYQHSVIGPVRAGDLLAAWAAHDTLHLRQIAKRQYQYLTEQSGNYKNSYAGEWKA